MTQQRPCCIITSNLRHVFVCLWFNIELKLTWNPAEHETSSILRHNRGRFICHALMWKLCCFCICRPIYNIHILTTTLDIRNANTWVLRIYKKNTKSGRFAASHENHQRSYKTLALSFAQPAKSALPSVLIVIHTLNSTWTCVYV